MRKLVIQGSFRSVGAQIGEATKDDLPFVRDSTIAFLLEQARASDLAGMRRIAAGYADSAEQFFPGAFEYMEGLAEGGDLAFEDVALITFSEEIRTEFHVPPSKCSTLAVPTQEYGWVIGHNEDYEPQYAGRMYALDLRIPGYPRTLSLNYPGHFPCLAGALNDHGVALAKNSLWPDVQPGLSGNLLHFRAALATDMDAAVGFLAHQPAALTSHYTVACGAQGDLAGIEVSNHRTAEELIAFFYPAREPYWHTNHARFLQLHTPDPAVTGRNHSLPRGEKLERLIVSRRLPTSPGEMLDLLSTNDGLLHRTPAQNATSVTLATVVICPEREELWIRDADPSAEPRDIRLSFYDRPPN